MEPFTTLEAVAIPIDQPNLDTDQIIPARFLGKPRTDPGRARCSTTCATTPDGTPAAGVRHQHAGLRGRADRGGRAQLRLRLLARERRHGDGRQRLPRLHRAELRRHLLQQLLPERRVADPPRRRTRGGDPRRAAREAGRAGEDRPREPDGRRSRRQDRPLRDRFLPQGLPAEGCRRGQPDAGLRARTSQPSRRSSARR